MKKVLFVANITGHINSFHLTYMRWFQEQGYQVHVAANGETPKNFCDKFYDVKLERSPYAIIKNYKAYCELKKIINAEKYNIVHCHTPMGGVLGRLCSIRSRKSNNTKVLYTVHGAHFYKGAPLKNWILYYNMERFLSRYTDAIITINQEDYNNFNNSQFKNKDLYRIPGIGVDTSRFFVASDDEKSKLRKKYGYRPESYLIIYTAEFIRRKNHRFLIEAMVDLVQKCPDIRLLLAGHGKLFEEMKALAQELKVNDNIDFLGYRSDVPQLVALSGVGISASTEEGFGLNLAEEMSAGLPIVCSNVRGHAEMIRPGENGFRFDVGDMIGYVQSIIHLENPQLRKKLGESAYRDSVKFSISRSLEAMEKIYIKYTNA